MKAQISKFEGVGPFWVYTLFLVAIGYGAIKTTGILSVMFWIVFVFIGIINFFQIIQLVNRFSAPWKGLYHPIMVRYSGIAGGLIARQGAPVDRMLASYMLVKSIYPAMTDDEVEAFVEEAFVSMEKFHDRDLIKEEVIKTNKYIDNKIEKFLDQMHEAIKKSIKVNDSPLPQWVAAEIIEKEVGKKEKGKFLFAYFTGAVN